MDDTDGILWKTEAGSQPSEPGSQSGGFDTEVGGSGECDDV